MTSEWNRRKPVYLADTLSRAYWNATEHVDESNTSVAQTVKEREWPPNLNS